MKLLRGLQRNEVRVNRVTDSLEAIPTWKDVTQQLVRNFQVNNIGWFKVCSFIGGELETILICETHGYFTELNGCKLVISTGTAGDYPETWTIYTGGGNSSVFDRLLYDGTGVSVHVSGLDHSKFLILAGNNLVYDFQQVSLPSNAGVAV